MEVIVYKDEAGEFRWKLVAENGEIISDSAEGYHHKGYAISVAEKLNPFRTFARVRGGWGKAGHPARSAKSQCQRIPHQRTSNRKSTTGRFLT
jgi:uncharacterized protein YegP (UPF0339 family)